MGVSSEQVLWAILTRRIVVDAVGVSKAEHQMMAMSQFFSKRLCEDTRTHITQPLISKIAYSRRITIIQHYYYCTQRTHFRKIL